MLLWGLGVSLAWSDMRLESNLLDSFSKTNCSSSLRWQLNFVLKKPLDFIPCSLPPPVVKEGFSSVSICFISFDSGAIWRLLQFAAVSTFEVRQMICARLEFVYQKRKLAVISALSQMKGTCYLVSLHSWLLLPIILNEQCISKSVQISNQMLLLP